MDFNPEDFSEGFSKMSNLRSLRIDGIGAYLNDQRHLALPNNLRYLQWHFCPFKCLASSHKQRMAFVHLDLQYGNFEYLWEGVMVILFFFNCVSIILYYFSFFFFFFFNCSYKYKYTPDVFELPPFIYKAVLLKLISTFYEKSFFFIFYFFGNSFRRT